MIKTVYVCDACNEEKTADTLYKLIAYTTGDEPAPAEITALMEDRHICPECIAQMFHSRELAAASKPVTRKTTNKQAKETIDMDEYRKRQAKRGYLTKNDERQIAQLYRAGKEIEEISDLIHVCMPPISRYVRDTGLNVERYGEAAG